MTLVPFLVSGWIFLIGIYGMVTSRNLVHAVGCLAVAQSATYVLLLGIGYRRGATAPVFSDVPVTTRVVDPVVQALVLTDVVVGATVTALLLSLVIQIRKRTGTVNPERLTELKG
ncbi:sodium:proton antiporter [Streptomyces sp. NBC_01190]|uniref:sodium:proton antiporter n=1 Tax=Streptomyces sp. NBC_01190 TaxID=2903767 RepID=UPI003863F7D8|nr:sodium:proton antiporter [Streptomyces sp. NBC_01190]